MTALMDRATSLRTKKPVRPTVAGLPQVNLLPPEVRAARTVSVVKRWLALSVLVVLVVIGAAFVFATFVRGQADERLADAEQYTTTLIAKEREYAEVPQVLGAIERTTRVRIAATGSEVVWRPYLDAVTAVMPADVRVVSFAATGLAPAQSVANAPASPLDQPSVGSLTFEAQSKTIPDVAAMLDALSTVPGLRDPWASALAVAEIDGTTYYTVSLTVQLSDTTLAQRFVPTEEN